MCYIYQVEYRNKNLLYIDESGVPSLTDKRSRYFLLAGVSVEEHRDNEISGFFEVLKRKYSINQGQPFHTTDLFEIKSSEIYLKAKDSRALAKSLAEFIEVAPFKVKVIAIDKIFLRKFLGLPKNLNSSDFRNDNTGTGKITRDIAYEIAASYLFFWFSNEILTNDNNRGAIIAESRYDADHALLLTFLNCKTPSKHMIKDVNETENSKKAVSMRSRVSSIKFENKLGECAGLEIADLICYLANLKAHKKLNKFKKRGILSLYKIAKKKLEGGDIIILNDNEILSCLPPDRVHKVSNFQRILKAKDLEGKNVLDAL